MSMQGLIPISKFQHGFSTCAALKHEHLIVVDLKDHPLGVHKVTSRTSHDSVKPPSPTTATVDSDHPDHHTLPQPSTAWQAKYPKGSINPSAPLPGGFGFHLAGPADFAQALQCGAQEVVVSYRMMLGAGWEWVKGGKLPGVYGGKGDLAYSCTGGRQANRCSCFNIRPMWRADGLGELYTYLPLTVNNAAHLGKVPPQSHQNSDYGFSVGRGSYHLNDAVGKWATMAFRVKLNDVGHENGEIEFWFNGHSVICVGGLTLRVSADSLIKGMHFQTFFGGHTDDWASPKDQFAWFADVTGVVIH
ncbi:hypothetical protein ONZ45_g5204 [Pleurotus djamor]|nr:hypothetical protein ONZ45_g5204 [Pleurotus djamor]